MLNNSDNNSNSNNNNNKKENLITMFKFLVQDEPETRRASLVSPEQCLNVEYSFEYPKQLFLRQPVDRGVLGIPA